MIFNNKHILQVYNNCLKYPFGKGIFSFLYCYKVPYFLTIAPMVQEIRPGHASISLKQKWILHNMIKSVHAIAVCNLVEACMGLVTEATLPSDLRWIPMGMEIAYEKKSYGKLTAHSDIDPNTFFKLEKYPGPVFVPVKVKNESGETVTTAKVKLWISKAKA
jgi:hypothetical protein